MASLKDIKRQIKSVKNTQKTTKAMKLVSTAKLKKAEEAAKRSRQYAIKINEILSEIAYKINQYKVGGVESRYFNKIENPKTIDLLFVTADKGLCGGFNSQTIKKVSSLMKEFRAKDVKVRLIAVGRKGLDFFRYQDEEILKSYVGVSASPTPQKAKEVIDPVIEDFNNGVTDGVILIHNGYLNMITQELKTVNLMPVEQIPEPKVISESMMEVEPADEEEAILESLVKKYFEYNIYYSLIDSLAGEHSSRMQAMDAATNNATEKVNKLTIAYNKARQEAITTELIEIISGMEALK